MGIETNNRVLNIKIPDKLYLSLRKAAERKSLSLAALVRVVCSDWIMEQGSDVKGIFTYPERIMAGLSADERAEFLETISFGGYAYNNFGEPCFDSDDDGADDNAYESLCTPEEAAASRRLMEERRSGLGAEY